MTRLRIGMVLVLLALLGGIGGWLWPPPPLPTTDYPRATAPWKVPPPEAVERSSASMTAQARNLKWLGDAAPGGSTALTEWTLKAILSGEDAILLTSGKEALISRAKVGDTLPDGSRLVALRGDTAVVELDGCRMDRHLYARAADLGQPECRTASLLKETQ